MGRTKLGVRKCLGVGYQGRSIAELCDALEAAGVARLVDVRERAWSHRPEYRKQALQRALGERGIEYVHCKEAGNPHRPRKGEERSWAECENLYAQHLGEHPEVLEALALLLEDGPAALFCYEAERSACHRGVLMRAIKARHPRIKLTDL